MKVFFIMFIDEPKIKCYGCLHFKKSENTQEEVLKKFLKFCKSYIFLHYVFNYYIACHCSQDGS